VGGFDAAFGYVVGWGALHLSTMSSILILVSSGSSSSSSSSVQSSVVIVSMSAHSLHAERPWRLQGASYKRGGVPHFSTSTTTSIIILTTSRRQSAVSAYSRHAERPWRLLGASYRRWGALSQYYEKYSNINN